MTDMSEAYHEAGHAIASHLNGRAIRRVSIVETDDAAGHVMRHSRGKKWLDALEEADHESCYGRFIDSRTRRAVEIEIMVSLAGGLTEMEALGLDKDDVSPGMELTFTRRCSEPRLHLGWMRYPRTSYIWLATTYTCPSSREGV